MSDRPTCKNCRFWAKGQIAYECRRHAPTITFDGNAWPETNADDWCGEFQPVNLMDPVDSQAWATRRFSLLDHKGKIS